MTASTLSLLPQMLVQLTVADFQQMLDTALAGGADRVLTTADVAEMFQTSESTVLRWVRAGEIPGVKLGGEYRYLRSELLARCRTHSLTAPAGDGVQQSAKAG